MRFLFFATLSLLFGCQTNREEFSKINNQIDDKNTNENNDQNIKVPEINIINHYKDEYNTLVDFTDNLCLKTLKKHLQFLAILLFCTM